MEDMNTTPVESTVQTDTVEPTNVQPAEPQADGPETQQELTRQAKPDAGHQDNWNNGKRRIAQRQSAKARIRELEAQIAELQGKNDDYSRFKSEQIQDRIDDMRAIDADAEATAFADRASQWFGDDTDAFMQDTYRYAEYVNRNEPDLLRYSQREYGPILLHEWYKRMDNPTLRAQWLGFTVYEKGAVLNNLYQQITNAVQRAKAPASTPKNVPAPAGGRETPAPTDGSDFGIALGEAFNRHKGR